jgi:hypothetical protein
MPATARIRSAGPRQVGKTTPSPQKGFSIACDDLAITRRFVVYPGTERFPLRHGAEAIGLDEMAAMLSLNGT